MTLIGRLIDCFFQIVDCIMTSLRDSNASIRNACAACIGELGAIDPGRFSYNLNQQGKFVGKIFC